MAKESSEEKTLKGLENKGIITFECADCDKQLLVLQMTSIKGDESAQVLTRIAVSCRECNGFSNVKQVVGQFHPGAPSDDMIFDILDGKEGAPETDVLFEAWSK